jgi:RHS repeat-associated protein
MTPLDRVRGQSDYFANWQMGRFDYGFDALGRHRYEQRDWGTTDGYQYDPSDEVTGYQRDGNLNGDGTVSVVLGNNTNVVYDNNGNRTQVTGVGADTYTVNNLNQYTNDTNTGTMLYDPKGNLTSAAGWTYGYDAQNRLTTMQGPGMTITQTYDPLNRVITRNVNGAVTQNVWAGWDLIEEHRPDWSLQRCYLQGANQNEMVAAFDGNVYSNHWYWQDGRGNTSHITGDNAALLERYTYDLSGAPKFYDEWDNERFGGSVYDTRFLFAGSQYLPETGLYDMRNRFYSPALNRFLQTDPIGFAGDALNLYRYCGDDPVDRSDPMGLDAVDNGDGTYSYTLQHNLRMESLKGWTVETFDKRGAHALQCAGAAQVLAATRERDGFHQVPLVADWNRGPDVTKSTPPVGTLVAKGWDKNGHYQNTSNLGPNYKGNHAGLFAGFVGKDHKMIRVFDQSINSRTGKPEALQIHTQPSAGWSRVNSDRPSAEDPSQQVLRPPEPPTAGNVEPAHPLSEGGLVELMGGTAGVSHPPVQTTLPL